MKSIFVFFSFLLSVSLLQAQEFYVCTFEFDPVNQTINQSIQDIDQNFNLTFITDVDLYAGNLSDIALSSNGKMYGITEGSVLIEINLTDGSTTNLHSFSSALNFTSLVYDNSDNLLWTLETSTNTLYSYSLDSMSVNSMTQIGVHTPGDLTFYKGNLIFINEEDLELVTYTGNQVETIACGGGQDFYGISNFVTSCNENLVYAFSAGGGVYRYNIEINDFQLVANLNLQDFVIFGSTSSTEYLASTCPFENLNAIDCTFGISQNSLDNLILYPTPTHDTVYVKNLPSTGGLYYTLYTVTGLMVKQEKLAEELSLGSLPDGIYFLKIYNEDKTIKITKKINKY